MEHHDAVALTNELSEPVGVARIKVVYDEFHGYVVQPTVVDDSGGWKLDGGGIQSGGDVGGDLQVSESYSVRFQHRTELGSVVTEYVYVSQYDPDEWVVSRQTEYIVCEDPFHPGDTELWSDYDYADLDPIYFDGVDEALRGAKQETVLIAEQGGQCIEWDGRGPWSE